MAQTDRVSLAIRITTIVLCSLLFILLLQRDYLVKTLDQRQTAALKRDREESFLGVYFKDQRIGYVKNQLLPTEPDGFILHQEAFLRLNILNESHPLRMQVTSTMSDNSLLRDFDFALDSPFYHMTAKGRVEGSRVDFRITTGSESITDSIRLERPPYLSTNLRGYLLTQGLAKGDKIRVPYFDPVSLSGKDTVMEYRGLDKILLKGRIYNLHHFIETFSGLRINSWLDDKGKVIKEESPAGFVFIAEPEFKATDIPKAPGQELLSSVAVPLEGTLPDPATATEIRYRLTLPPDLELDALATGRQELDGDILTVRREPVPGADAAACTDPKEDLASTPYVQAKNTRISEQAAAITQDSTSAMERVRVISSWVYEHVDKRPVLGIPDALTTLETLRGDCNEHAALFAALARSAGIPTRIVAGVTLFQDAFYYHAWNEVCLDGHWLSIDTTKNQIPADLSHIKFVQGETKAMITITGLIGKLRIEALNAEEEKMSTGENNKGIVVEKLTKRFGDFAAVDGVNLTVRAGEIFAFLGPNGAGKTTTIKMLAGLLKPDQGRILINGRDLACEPVACKQVTGYIPDRPFLYEKLTGQEFLEFIASLYHLPPERFSANADRLLALFDLTDWRHHLIESFSHGMRQKLIMTSAFMLEPPLIIVDEPMVGLDPKSARIVKELFKSHARRGGAVFLSTHSLEIAEELCDRIAIILNGRIRAMGDLESLRREARLEGSHLEEIFLELTGAYELHEVIAALRKPTSAD